MSTDHWQPSASIQSLKKRAELLQRIRNFFNQRGYLEVETPSMGQFGVTDLYLSNITAAFRKQTCYLQTSPEYHMKRLLAAGSGPIYQFARVFRDDELGRWHNPEFSMLEWYQLSIDHHALMDEMDELLQAILACPAMLKKNYQQVFVEYCGLDPIHATIAELRSCLAEHDLANVLAPDEQDRDQYLFLMMSHLIEPAFAELDTPVAVYDFPLSQAALAKINGQWAERFEIYYRGVELANGFHELTDANLQQARFERDNQLRRERGLEEKTLDPHFLAALSQGMPECAGVALGLDRLIALSLNHSRISEVMAFDFERA